MPKVTGKKPLSAAGREAFLSVLQARFERNKGLHKGLIWSKVQPRLQAKPSTLVSIYAMEQTGGEPDVIGFDAQKGEYVFADCSPESPSGRRNTCYDHIAQQEREKKGVHPAGNVQDMAARMGIELMTEEQYRALQQLGSFDTKTSSWLQTPTVIRKLGGAIFADRRYDHVFIYHNSAPSFYSSRGFRGMLRV